MTTTITWPGRLPLPTLDSYAVQPQDSIARTDMEAGAARTRRRYTSSPSRIPVRWRFTALEFGLFEAWFHVKVTDGAEWFAVDLLGGLGLSGHEARFLGDGGTSYKAQPQRGGPGDGPRWIVTALLEVRNRPLLSGDALDLALSEDIAALFADVSCLHSTLHAGLPDSIRW